MEDYLKIKQEKMATEYKLKNAERLLKKVLDIFYHEHGRNKECCEIMEYFDGSYDD